MNKDKDMDAPKITIQGRPAVEYMRDAGVTEVDILLDEDGSWYVARVGRPRAQAGDDSDTRPLDANSSQQHVA